ncbi:recombinase family protein [Halomonas daqiaonensis]|uniref:Resolvase, N terminal domain n=1 Tax=Halomonas daqiaonensis TaxID=650850 RepID=A0A1H7KI98_9GAMM|nr:Resolvase, N terminal domain [Halomonas daqiaonensis]
MIIGYARVSTQDQNPQLQRDALEEAGCEQVFEERVTGTKRERPELQACLRTLRDGDCLTDQSSYDATRQVDSGLFLSQSSSIFSRPISL